jgi:hypothetical protein
MATESPLIHDGSHTTASVDMSATSSLTGLNGTGQYLGVVISGSKTVAYDSTGGSVIYGILQNAPASGQPADVGIFGVSKAVMGAAATAGADLMTNSAGRLITATSTNRRFAILLETCSAAGQVCSVFITGANRTA